MVNKRFENRLNKNNKKFNALNPCWDHTQGTAINVFEMIDLLNELQEAECELCELLSKIYETIQYYRAEEVTADDDWYEFLCSAKQDALCVLLTETGHNVPLE